MTNVTSNNANTTPVWITLRSVEPEFLQFLGASSAEDAIAKALIRCTDANGNIQESALVTFKRDFLKFAQAAMGLPTNIATL